MSTANAVTLVIDGAIARLSIDRPAQRNAMTHAMWQALGEHLKTIRGSDARALMLCGSGEHFCAGADIAELRSQLADPDALQANARLVQAVQAELAAMPIPSLAVIRGACVGGGVGLAVACDLRFATSDARFALTPTRLGLHYSLADTRRLAAVIGLARAREMLLTAALVDAPTAAAWGLVSRRCDDPETLEREALEQALAWTEASPDALACTKRVLGQLDGSQPAAEADLSAAFLAAFDGPDFREGASAFLEKRSPHFPGKTD